LRVGACAGLALGLVAPTGCDSTAVFFPQRTSFQAAVVVSAYPAARKNDGSWERSCTGDAGPVTGVITNAVLVSTQPKSNDDNASTEADLSIRPGDTVETRTVNGSLSDDINLEAAGNLGFTLDCIDPQPQPNPSAGGCQGAVPSAQLESVEYVENTPSRKTAHNVIVLIDQSGSVGGIVDPDEANRENQSTKFDPPTNFGELASDKFSTRLSAARTFINSLNSDDRLGVIGFGESENSGAGFSVPCATAVGLDVATGLANCFGRNRDLWLEPVGTPPLAPLDSLRGRALGRSNLWKAVQTAYDFLDGQPDSDNSNHIVVLTDGPDTCLNGENITNCAAPCSTVTHEQVMQKLMADRNDPNGKHIRIHFVQFESVGYEGRDPRQVEAACVSGGHYQYINANDFPREQVATLQGALDQALLNVRFSLMGHWELAAEIPAYAQNTPAPTGTPPGSLYALSGQLVVRQSSNMVSADRAFPFGIGQGVGAEDSPAWDRRPTVLKPCGSAADCGAAGAADACTVVCSDETHICPNDATGVTLPDTAACDPGGGGSAYCCDGECINTGGACAICNP